MRLILWILRFFLMVFLLGHWQFLDAQDQNPTQQSLEHLQSEIDKGRDPDDVAKMIRIWSKLTAGEVLTTQERSMLVDLINRKPRRTKNPLSADSAVYTSTWALQLLKLEERNRKDEEIHHQQQKQIQKQQKQIDSLLEQINQLIEHKKTQ